MSLKRVCRKKGASVFVECKVARVPRATIVACRGEIAPLPLLTLEKYKSMSVRGAACISYREALARPRKTSIYLLSVRSCRYTHVRRETEKTARGVIRGHTSFPARQLRFGSFRGRSLFRPLAGSLFRRSFSISCVNSSRKSAQHAAPEAPASLFASDK